MCKELYIHLAAYGGKLTEHLHNLHKSHRASSLLFMSVSRHETYATSTAKKQCTSNAGQEYERKMLYHIIRCDPFYVVVALTVHSPANKNIKRNLAMAAYYVYAPSSKMTTKTVQHVATKKKKSSPCFNTCKEMQNDGKILTTNVRKNMFCQDSVGI